MVLTEYSLKGLIYIATKEILKVRPYAKGIKTVNDLIAIKGYKDVILGKVTKGQLVQVEDNKTGRQPKFVNKNEVLSLFDTDSNDVKILEPAPPILRADDLVFFKDNDGVEHHVLMRGERGKDKIFFKLKDVEKVFQMERLDETIQQDKSAYTEGKHYQWFNISYNEKPISYGFSSKENIDKSDGSTKENKRSKELYFTYVGLKHLIEASRSGVAYKFKTWLDDVLFAVSFGTVEQKATVLARSFDTDVEHLKAFISKTGNDISCLYLIDIKQMDDGKHVYKYGYTKHLSKRMYQHKRKYGDNIELVQWVLVPEQFLSEAETKIRDVSAIYSFKKEGEQELISMSDDELKTVLVSYDLIARRYQGSAEHIKTYFENIIKDTKHDASMQVLKAHHEVDLIKKDLEAKERQLEAANQQIQWLQHSSSFFMPKKGSHSWQSIVEQVLLDSITSLSCIDRKILDRSRCRVNAFIHAVDSLNRVFFIVLIGRVTLRFLIHASDATNHILIWDIWIIMIHDTCSVELDQLINRFSH